MTTGKWTEKKVPHRGWTCLAIVDRRKTNVPYTTCEMCCTRLVRFAHMVTHPQYNHVLAVGSSCCAALCQPYKDDSGSIVSTREAETYAKQAAVNLMVANGLERLWHSHPVHKSLVRAYIETGTMVLEMYDGVALINGSETIELW